MNDKKKKATEALQPHLVFILHMSNVIITSGPPFFIASR